jgi:DNA-binding GntR family transcriptional regulator
MGEQGSQERRERSSEAESGHRARLPSVRIENDLRRRLKDHEFPADERLSLRTLAAEYTAQGFGAGPSKRVSHETVRRAVLKIAQDGLLEVVPNWGVYALYQDNDKSH